MSMFVKPVFIALCGNQFCDGPEKFAVYDERPTKLIQCPVCKCYGTVVRIDDGVNDE